MFIDEANHIYTTIPMYNLVQYSDNYSDTSGISWQLRADEVSNNNSDLTVNNSQSFKYKVVLVGKTTSAVNDENSFVKNTKIVVPLKYSSHFWILLKIQLISCKIHLESIGSKALFCIVLETLQNLK